MLIPLIVLLSMIIVLKRIYQFFLFKIYGINFNLGIWILVLAFVFPIF